jgi:queuine tRNA-ribosyltransferase
MADEMLGPILLSLHNVAFYQQLMRELRVAIKAGRAAEFRSAQLAAWDTAV